MSEGPRTRAILTELAVEFPDFAILPKTKSRLQRAIHVALAVLTFGGQRVYLTRYHTVMFGKLWVPDAWSEMNDDARYVLLCHERVHLRQSRRMGSLWMAFVYLVPFFPLFLAYGRARLEWEAYTETLRATAEVSGIDAALALRSSLVERFCGGAYGFMWPFPRTIHRWFEDAVRDLGHASGSSAAP